MSKILPVVLVPGLLCDRRLYGHQIGPLEDRGPVMVADVTIDANLADIAERVLADAPQHFALVGFSMGGYVAFEILRRAPERVARLALIDTQARSDTEAQRQRRLDLIELTERGQFDEVIPRLLPLLIHEDRLDDKELTEMVHTMAEDVGAAGFIRQQRAIMARPDSRPQLVAITIPTLIVAGRDDALTPPEVQHEMAEGIAHADLVLLAHCGHLSPLERPDAVTCALLAWLTSSVR